MDAVIHAVGFAPREELDGDFLDATSREGFSIAHDISSYSFIGLAKAAKPFMAGRQRVFTDPILSWISNDYAQLQCYGASQGKPRS